MIDGEVESMGDGLTTVWVGWATCRQRS